MSSTDAHPGCQAWNSCAGRAPTARNTSAATSRTARNTNEVPATAPSIATSTSAGRQRAARWNWNAEQQKVRATSTREAPGTGPSRSTPGAAKTQATCEARPGNAAPRRRRGRHDTAVPPSIGTAPGRAASVPETRRVACRSRANGPQRQDPIAGASRPRPLARARTASLGRQSTTAVPRSGGPASTDHRAWPPSPGSRRRADRRQPVHDRTATRIVRSSAG